MILWWIGDIVLLARRRCPVVVYLLHGVLSAAESIVPSVQAIAARSRPRARRISTPPRCC